jgi:hypothetical protein
MFHPVGWALASAPFLATVVPGAFYGFIRGAQIGSCDVGGFKKVRGELFDLCHVKSTTLGSNFLPFTRKILERREKKKES